MNNTRKKYSDTKKLSIVKETIEGGFTAAEIGKKYGIHSSLISRWIRKFKSGNVEEIKEESEDGNIIENYPRVSYYLNKFLEEGEDHLYENSTMLTNSIIEQLFTEGIYDYQKNKFFDFASIDQNHYDNISDFTKAIRLNSYIMKLITKYVRTNGMYGKNDTIGYMISNEFLCMIDIGLFDVKY